MYAHLNSSGSYSRGSEVQKGEVIGEIGGTSDADCNTTLSNHLHFEIRKELMLSSRAIDVGNIELKYEVGMWPATGESDGGQNFITENYYSPSKYINEIPTSIDSFDDVEEKPTEIELSQNYPNPFNPSTTIRYALPEATTVKLEVFNMLGQRVALLADERKSTGWHSATFDASNLSSGMYIYRLQAQEFVETRKLTLIK